MRCELADYEWAAIKSMLPNKPRGVPRVNDRRVLNGTFWVLQAYPATVLHCAAKCSAPRSDSARIV